MLEMCWFQHISVNLGPLVLGFRHLVPAIICSCPSMHLIMFSATSTLCFLEIACRKFNIVSSFCSFWKAKSPTADKTEKHFVQLG